MPFFVVTPFQGTNYYTIEWTNNKNDVERHSGGSKKWPEPKEIIAIPDAVAWLGIDRLQAIYEGHKQAENKIVVFDSNDTFDSNKNRYTIAMNVARALLTHTKPEGLDVSTAQGASSCFRI